MDEKDLKEMANDELLTRLIRTAKNIGRQTAPGIMAIRMPLSIGGEILAVLAHEMLERLNKTVNIDENIDENPKED